MVDIPNNSSYFAISEQTNVTSGSGYFVTKIPVRNALAGILALEDSSRVGEGHTLDTRWL